MHLCLHKTMQFKRGKYYVEYRTYSFRNSSKFDFYYMSYGHTKFNKCYVEYAHVFEKKLKFIYNNLISIFKIKYLGSYIKISIFLIEYVQKIKTEKSK